MHLLIVHDGTSRLERIGSFLPALTNLGCEISIYSEALNVAPLSFHSHIQNVPPLLRCPSLRQHLFEANGHYHAVLFSSPLAAETYRETVSLLSPKSALLCDSAGFLVPPDFLPSGSASSLERAKLAISCCDILLVGSPLEYERAQILIGERVCIRLLRTVVRPQDTIPREAVSSKTMCILLAGDFERSSESNALSDFLDSILPLLHRGGCTPELLVQGHGLSPSLRARARSLGAQIIPDTGNLLPYHIANCIVAPNSDFDGEKPEVLRAMATGLPVLSSFYVARYFDPRHSVNMLIASSKLAIAESVIALCNGSETSTDITRAARKACIHERSHTIAEETFATLLEGDLTNSTKGARYAQEYHRG